MNLHEIAPHRLTEVAEAARAIEGENGPTAHACTVAMIFMGLTSMPNHPILREVWKDSMLHLLADVIQHLYPEEDKRKAFVNGHMLRVMDLLKSDMHDGLQKIDDHLRKS
jgi:hypothetical protein